MIDDHDNAVAGIVAAMSDIEKVDLLSGHGLWKTSAIDRLGIPAITLTDGTYGVRYSTTQILPGDDPGAALRDFLAVVNRRSDDDSPEGMFGTTHPATCFPNGNLLGCSWDVDLAFALGQALADECRNLGIQLLLGPGINIRRTPLAGRAYEYYSEDPVVSGDLAAGVIRGLQGSGVAASLKHFACNNSEIDRTSMSSDVDERALREIYLAGFERAIAKSDPWTVMSAYNPVNGVQSAESHWLLTTVLREEWGFSGLVMSDWHAIKDRPAALHAGTDLDMPESAPRKKSLLDALEKGGIDRPALDRSCMRMLSLVRRLSAAAAPAAAVDLEMHHRLARRMAAESIVLLKNDNACLPLHPNAASHILVIGDGAIRPMIQGSGSATTNPFRVDIPLDAIRALAGGQTTVRFLPFGKDAEAQTATRIADIVDAAGAVDTVVVFASHRSGKEGEGSDRDDLGLAPGQDALIEAVSRLGRRTIVVLTMPDAVTMPWLGEVDAVLGCFYPGQGGGEAIARILFGHQNPCGKLSSTMPVRLEDIPGFHTYPGENGHHRYSEGIFAGYRHFDRGKVEPLFCFGHGLSYTAFAYEALSLDAQEIAPGKALSARVTIRNTGAVAGKEIVQLYVRPIEPGLKRPLRELKAFVKVELSPGEAKVVDIALSPRDFQYYDTATGRWTLRAASFAIDIGASLRDVRLTQTLPCRPDPVPVPNLSATLSPAIVFSHPQAEEALQDFLRDRLKISPNEARSILDGTRQSFLGFYNTLTWFIGDTIRQDEIEALFSRLNSTR